jgi:hypothetical protein
MFHKMQFKKINELTTKLKAKATVSKVFWAQINKLKQKIAQMYKFKTINLI